MRRRWLLLAIALVVLAAEIVGAVVQIVVGDHNDAKWATLAFAVPPGVAFALAGIVAVWRRPGNWTGVYLGAVGYVWFVGALGESNNDWLFSSATVLSSFAFIPFILLILSYPTGRLETHGQRVYVVVSSVALIVIPLTLLLVDETPERSCINGCRNSPIAVVDSERTTDIVTLLATLIGIGLIVWAGTLLVARWRRATAAHRNALRLVLTTSGVAILALLVLNAIDAVSSSASDSLSPVFLLAFTAVPISFLVGILRTRLARSSVAELVVELGRGAPIEDALAQALGDPTLEVAYRDDDCGWIDASWLRPVPNPATHDGRNATQVVGERGLIATLVHDPSLDEEPELVHAVTAAASLSLENEPARRRPPGAVGAHRDHRRHRAEPARPRRSRRPAREGEPRAVRAVGLETSADLVGRPFWDVFIAPAEREAMIERFWAAGPPTSGRATRTRSRTSSVKVRVIAGRAPRSSTSRTVSPGSSPVGSTSPTASSVSSS